MRVYVKALKARITASEGGSVKHVIWGDWLDVEDHPDRPDKYIVNWKAWNAQSNSVGIEKYVIARSDCQTEALLEMIFLDVGQGDGCIVSVPDGNSQRTLIIDAGERTNMHRFLKWRFRYVDDGAQFHAAVLTHPDMDHYKGFQPIFDDARISFDTVYHNGLMERVAAVESDLLGARANGQCTEIFPARDVLDNFLSVPARRGDKLYPKLLWTALQAPARFGDIRMAAVGHGDAAPDGRTYLPGFAPAGAGLPSIEILGPVPETTPAGAPALKTFGDNPNDGGFDVGKTKNGHSVILKLRYRDFSAVFGGDLNRPAEDYLLRHYGEIGVAAKLSDALPKAKQRLGADLLKCCHHGSSDVTDEFVEAVNPFAFVVSSGDEESHVHPKPELLGLLGKKGRGDRPLILCTEILRSTPESRSLTTQEQATLDKLIDAVDTAANPTDRKKARKAVNDFWNARFRRLVNVYGAITLRTDGRTLLIAFRKEKVKGSPWQLYKYSFTGGAWVGGAA